MTAVAPWAQEPGRRSAARLAAVQALYQVEFGGAAPESVIIDFVDHRLGAEVDGEVYAEADTDFFRAVVRGGAGRTAELDQLLTEVLIPTSSGPTNSARPSVKGM